MLTTCVDGRSLKIKIAPITTTNDPRPICSQKPCSAAPGGSELKPTSRWPRAS
jgi:hypothetical protein